MVECSLCGSNVWRHLHTTKDGVAAFTKAATFNICGTCGLITRHPVPDSTEDFYQLEYWGDRPTPDLLFRSGEKQRQQAEAVREITGDLSRTIVDVGCGFGALTGALADVFTDARVVGVEPDLRLSELLAEHNQRPNVRIAAAPLEHLTEIGAEVADLVVLSTVFEHLIDPVAALATLRAVTSERGWLLIVVPDVDHPGRFGLDWFLRDFHLRYYSERTLTAMLATGGFEVTARLANPVFSGTGVPFLAVLARPADRPPMPELGGEAARIEKHVDAYKRRTRLVGPARFVWNYRLRRPISRAAVRLLRR
ncbi:MAG: class I SAM-dependent methyltransferase [Acidimicrobiia bacterium]|nr:class I SAM-dependent methyltransferase [Acidimicrobiia bacterium]